MSDEPIQSLGTGGGRDEGPDPGPDDEVVGPEDGFDRAPAERGGVAGPGQREVKPGGRVGPGSFAASEAELAGAPGAIVLNPDYGFENFVVGPGNQLAYAAAVAVGDNPGRAYNPLFIHGDVGLGKTHLLQAVCVKIKRTRPGAVLHYVSCDGFINDFMNSVASGRMVEFRHRFRDVDVLVIDDIHFLAKRDRTQEEFFHTFNSLYQAHKQIVLSSDAAPHEIPHVEDRLVSRFKWGLVAKIEPPTFETRVAILLSKARLRGIELPPGVAEFVAGKIDTNIRELEGSITKLQLAASVEGRAIDLELSRRLIGGAEPRAARGPSIEDIITVVCDFYDVRRTDVLGKRRHQSVSLPRQVCMYLARRHTRHSLEEVGGQFGGRDHTTVLHAVRSIEEKRETDGQLDAVIRRLEGSLRDGAAAAEG